VAGEQFALGESVGKLRQLRDVGSTDHPASPEGNGSEVHAKSPSPAKPREELIVISAADPLNLAGVLTNDARVPAISTNRIAYLNGIAVAALQAGEWKSLNPLPEHLVSVIAEKFGLSGRSLPKRFERMAAAGNDQPDSEKESQSEAQRRERAPSRIPRPMIS
jgi:hypothetical protein